jgi:hypothetical protein
VEAIEMGESWVFLRISGFIFDYNVEADRLLGCFCLAAALPLSNSGLKLW